ncbi:MAG TPA: PAS domain S-box protein [Atribacteraceae bacterium]|nr:PAS domain S-box protein [Atribacteraceae bacterium]
MDNTLGLEKTIIAATSCLINLEPKQMENRIQELLGIISRYAAADRSYLIFLSDDGESMDLAVEWAAVSKRSHIQPLQSMTMKRFTWLVQELAKRQSVAFLSLEDLPPAAVKEREILRSQSIEAAVFVPVFHHDSWIGFFGLESATKSHVLLEGLSVLKIVAPLVGILWEKRSTENSFLNDEKRFHALIKHVNDLIWILDARGIMKFASPSVLRILGYEPAALEGKSIFAFVHPDERCFLEGFFFQRIRLPGALVSYPPFRFKHHDGSWIYLESTGNNLLQEPTIQGIVLSARDVSDRKKIEEDLAFEQNLLRTLVNTIPDSVFVQDREGRVLLVNEALLRQCGFEKPQDVIGKAVNEVFLPGCGIRPPSPGSQPGDQRGESPGQDQEVYGSDGGVYLTSLIPFRSHQGEIGGMVGVSRDITRSRNTENALRIAEQEKRVILNNLSELVCFLDRECTLIWANQAWMMATGRQLDEVQGQRCHDIWPPATHRCEHCPTRKALLDGRVQEGEITDPDGAMWWVRGSPVRGSDGSVAGVVEIRLNITERKQTEDRIRYLSYHDSLTGLFNRSFFEEELQRIDREAGHPVSIFIGDVNGLKIVNDAFGHQRGDELLRRMSALLKESFREEDIICRWGGDEFAVLLLRTPGEVCQKILERVQSLCQQASSEAIPLSIALGYATKDSPTQDIQSIIRLAEERMYRKKFTESYSARHSIILSLERSLQETTLETEEHARRMRTLSQHLGEHLKLSDDELNELDLLARLHDLGKIAMPRSILTKPAALDQNEWEEIKKHPEIGYRIALSSKDMMPIAEAILSHHERWDGNGYPRGLAGRKIPLLARIISVIDAFDVMTNGRPYRLPMDNQQAIEELRRCEGTQFDRRIVRKFIELIENGILP